MVGYGPLMCCPLCGNGKVNDGPFCVVVWQAHESDTCFGLAAADRHKVVCCSFAEGEYHTREEAQKEADDMTPEYVLSNYGGY